MSQCVNEKREGNRKRGGIEFRPISSDLNPTPLDLLTSFPQLSSFLSTPDPSLTFSVSVTLLLLRVEKPEEQSVSVGELGQEWECCCCWRGSVRPPGLDAPPAPPPAPPPVAECRLLVEEETGPREKEGGWGRREEPPPPLEAQDSPIADDDLGLSQF